MRKTDLTYLVEILSKHLKAASVHFRVEELQLCLLSCPTDISALSVVQAYTCLGAKANVFRADYNSTLKWGKPFLAQLDCNGKKSFVFVEKITEIDAVYYEGRLKRIVAAIDFKKEWTGIVIAIEKNKETCKGRKWLKAFMRIFLLLCIIVLFLTNPYLSMLANFNCLLNIMGAILCLGVIMQISLPYYDAFDHFCIANTKLDCQKLDLGKLGMLFRKVNLGRIGFIYFISCFLAIILVDSNSESTAIYGWLSVASSFTLIVAVLSISYQLFVRQFCLLCLGIMGILIINGILFYAIKGIPFLYFSLNVGVFFLLVVLVSCGLLYVWEYYVGIKQRSLSTRINELRIKRMQSVLEYFFMTKNILSSNDNSIILGNSKAPLTLTTYLSPWCETCKKVALEMIKLLHRYPDYINWQIYFDGVKKSSVDEVNSPQLYLYQYLISEEDINNKLDMLKYWYRKKSIKGLLTMMKASTKDISAILDKFNNQLEAMMDAQKVPIVWINNRSFPSCYSLTDFPYVLLDLCMIYSQEEKI